MIVVSYGELRMEVGNDSYGEGGSAGLDAAGGLLKSFMRDSGLSAAVEREGVRCLLHAGSSDASVWRRSVGERETDGVRQLGAHGVVLGGVARFGGLTVCAPGVGGEDVDAAASESGGRHYEPGGVVEREQATVASELSGSACGTTSAKTARNRQWRADKKNRKVQRKAAGVDWRSRGEVRAFPEAVDDSWVARKNAENKLKEMQALRQIELLQARDVEDEKRKQRTRVLEQTERSKVNIERAYMSLRATGNVAGSSGGGSAETVFTGASVEGVPGLGPGDGSISPDSSVSLSEVREIQKRNLDLEKKSDDLEKELADLRKEVKRTGLFEALGCGREVVFTEYEGANSFGVAPSVAERLREMDENGEITHYVDNEFLGGVVVRRDLNVLYDDD